MVTQKTGYIVELYFTFYRAVKQGQSIYNYITCPLPPAAKCILGEDYYNVLCNTQQDPQSGIPYKVATFHRNLFLVSDEQHIQALQQASEQTNSLYYPFPYLTPFADESQTLTIPLPRSSYVLIGGLVSPYPLMYMRAKEIVLPLPNGVLTQSIEVIAHVILSEEKLNWIKSHQFNLIEWPLYCSYTGENLNFYLRKDKVKVLGTLSAAFEQGQSYIPTHGSRLPAPKFFKLDYNVSTDLRNGYLFQQLSDAYVEAKTILYDAGDPTFSFSVVEIDEDPYLLDDVHHFVLRLPFRRILANTYDPFNNLPAIEFIPYTLHKLEKPLPFKFSTFFKSYWEASTPTGGMLKVGDKIIIKENFSLQEVTEDDVWREWGVKEGIQRLPRLPFKVEGLL